MWLGAASIWEMPSSSDNQLMIHWICEVHSLFITFKWALQSLFNRVSEIGRQHMKAPPAATISPLSNFTQPMQPMNVRDICIKNRPPHWELHALLFSNSEWVSVSQAYYLFTEGLWDGAYSLSYLSEKTSKSNHLHMSLQRQHFLLSYFEDPECWFGQSLNPQPPTH